MPESQLEQTALKCSHELKSNGTLQCRAVKIIHKLPAAEMLPNNASSAAPN